MEFDLSLFLDALCFSIDLCWGFYLVGGEEGWVRREERHGC